MVGSGTPGGPETLGTGTTVSVMFASVRVPPDRWVVAVKNPSVESPYCDAAQKFPSPVCPGL